MSDVLGLVRSTAAAHGFEIVGVTSGAPLADALEALRSWSDAGHGADLGYMTRNPPERADPRTLLKDVRSIVTVAVNHWTDAPPFLDERRYGRVARYAWGLDYHDVVIPRLTRVGEELVERLGGTCKIACDHSPILERAFAARAGLGFFGKNTCLLLPRRGSFFFLAELLLSVEFPESKGHGTDHCGTCVSCLDRCPTDAFPAPLVLDARRCISYLTIEHRGPIPLELRKAMGAWVFGCDACQDVCPFNRYAEPAPWPELAPDRGVGPRLDLARTLAIPTDVAFRARFGGTPLLRPRRRGLLRNAAIAARNVRAEETVPLLRKHAMGDPEELVRGAALWALEGLAPDEARGLAENSLRADPDEAVRDEARRILDENA